MKHKWNTYLGSAKSRIQNILNTKLNNKNSWLHFMMKSNVVKFHAPLDILHFTIFRHFVISCNPSLVILNYKPTTWLNYSGVWQMLNNSLYFEQLRINCQNPKAICMPHWLGSLPAGIYLLSWVPAGEVQYCTTCIIQSPQWHYWQWNFYLCHPALSTRWTLQVPSHLRWGDMGAQTGRSGDTKI